MQVACDTDQASGIRPEIQLELLIRLFEQLGTQLHADEAAKRSIKFDSICHRRLLFMLFLFI
jgi:hypothetical protein